MATNTKPELNLRVIILISFSTYHYVCDCIVGCDLSGYACHLGEMGTSFGEDQTEHVYICR